MSEEMVVVTWEDTTNVAQWQTRGEMAEWAGAGGWVCHNVGWVVHEDDDCIVLAARLVEDEEQHVGLAERIPKRAILSRQPVDAPERVALPSTGDARPSGSPASGCTKACSEMHTFEPPCEQAIRRTEPWWVHHADHMKGWEAFGCTGQEPTVRRLGMVTFGKNHKGPATTEERPGTEPFGTGEVRLGVAGVMFSTHADDRTGGFLHVVGTTREDVAARWRHVDRAVRSWLPDLWPTSRASR